MSERRALPIPNEIVPLICGYLGVWQDIVNLALTSKEMHQKCSMTPRQLEKILQHIFIQQLCVELPAGEKKLERMINSSHNEPFITAGLGALWEFRTRRGSVPPNAISSAMELAVMYEKSGRVGNAIEVLEMIWEKRTGSGNVPPDVVQPAMRLTELYEKSGRVGNAIEVLEMIWEKRTGSGNIPPDVVQQAMRLTELYEKSGRVGNAIEVLEMILEKRTGSGNVPPDVVQPAMRLTELYRKTGRITEVGLIETALINLAGTLEQEVFPRHRRPVF
ncbi:hypothetical protein BJX66DRAFT_320782 [Aspergillus keveii]|uniref:Uncharacterized protein n=1 Tax=Aspergillus keveii TaxID=714993 RepID=A0ABR4FGP6_9EURO